jgi:hypothetical protein
MSILKKSAPLVLAVILALAAPGCNGHDPKPAAWAAGSVIRSGFQGAVRLDCERFAALWDQVDDVVQARSVLRFSAYAVAARSEAPTFEDALLRTAMLELSDYFHRLAAATARGQTDPDLAIVNRITEIMDKTCPIKWRGER